jgi:hypothetical protein
MAVTTIAHKAELTKEQAQEIFARHFAGKYVVRDFSGPFRDFAVDKNAFIAIAVKLEQTDSETKFVYTGLAPRWWARMLLPVLWGFLLWTPMTNEIRLFIESAREFH